MQRIMVPLTTGQRRKLGSVAKKGAGTVLRVSAKALQGRLGTDVPMILTDHQVELMDRARNNGKGTQIRLTGDQMQDMITDGGFLPFLIPIFAAIATGIAAAAPVAASIAVPVATGLAVGAATAVGGIAVDEIAKAARAGGEGLGPIGSGLGPIGSGLSPINPANTHEEQMKGSQGTGLSPLGSGLRPLGSGLVPIGGQITPEKLGEVLGGKVGDNVRAVCPHCAGVIEVGDELKPIGAGLSPLGVGITRRRQTPARSVQKKKVKESKGTGLFPTGVRPT